MNPTLPTIPNAGKVSVPPAVKNTSICYKYVGCFDNYPPFDNSGGVLPSPPERVGTKIILYTNKNKLVGKYFSSHNYGHLCSVRLLNAESQLASYLSLMTLHVYSL